jgi:outer membrane lipoprotein SlyB
MLAAMLVSMLLSLSACTVYPSGPRQLIMPNQNASFDSFQSDDAMCRQFAHRGVDGFTPNTAAMAPAAFFSTVAGATLGAASGGAWGNSQAALIGAAIGANAWATTGLMNTRESAELHQQSYDNGYIQCMYTRGHQVPASGYVTQQVASRYNPSAPPPPADGSYRGQP